jgi:hypothetical protein
MESAPVAGHDQSIRILTDHLLVQAEPRDLPAVLQLADREGSGLVLTGKAAIEACRNPWRAGFSRALLADRRRYAGKARCRGTVIRLLSGRR